VSSSTPSALRLAWPLPLGFRCFRAESNLGPDLFFRDTYRFARSVLLLAGPEGPAVRTLDSSLGVHQRSPLRQYRCRVSTPGWAEARPSARSCQTPDAFRPCRSSRLRRFTPPDTLQVCCTLHPAMGFATFPARPAPEPGGSSWGRAFPSGARPFGVFPSAAGRGTSPRSDPLSPLFQPSSRGPPVLPRLIRALSTFARPQGVAPPRSPLRRAGVAAAKSPDTPMGFRFVDAARLCLPLRGLVCVPSAGPRIGAPRLVGPKTGGRWLAAPWSFAPWRAGPKIGARRARCSVGRALRLAGPKIGARRPAGPWVGGWAGPVAVRGPRGSPLRVSGSLASPEGFAGVPVLAWSWLQPRGALAGLRPARRKVPKGPPVPVCSLAARGRLRCVRLVLPVPWRVPTPRGPVARVGIRGCRPRRPGRVSEEARTGLLCPLAGQEMP
jgi:hypothetical protein